MREEVGDPPLPGRNRSPATRCRTRVPCTAPLETGDPQHSVSDVDESYVGVDAGIILFVAVDVAAVAVCCCRLFFDLSCGIAPPVGKAFSTVRSHFTNIPYVERLGATFWLNVLVPKCVICDGAVWTGPPPK
jgi:hypothetical protein